MADYSDRSRMAPLEQYSQAMLLYFLFLKTVITLTYSGPCAHSGESWWSRCVSTVISPSALCHDFPAVSFTPEITLLVLSSLVCVTVQAPFLTF